MTTIPSSFLTRKPPRASLRLLDFERTQPPIPAYKDHFAAIIDHFLTPTECSQILRLAEESALTGASVSWERAMVNVGNGRQAMAVDTRNCGRILWDTPVIADRLFARLQPFLHQCGVDVVQNRPIVTGWGPAKLAETYRVAGLNERLRFLRYEGGEYFRPHADGMYVTPDGTQRSLLSIHLYLNGNDTESGADADTAEGGLVGGATAFTDKWFAEEREDDSVRVVPKTGSLLVFQQRNLVHAGEDVVKGVKYTMRTDVMYEKVPQESA